jgi:hypothetical protein
METPHRRDPVGRRPADPRLPDTAGHVSHTESGCGPDVAPREPPRCRQRRPAAASFHQLASRWPKRGPIPDRLPARAKVDPWPSFPVTVPASSSATRMGRDHSRGHGTSPTVRRGAVEAGPDIPETQSERRHIHHRRSYYT